MRMSYEIEAASALLASCALMMLVTCAMQNVKAWGQTKRLGDLPAGVMLGATSVVQMYHPIEPYPGFILDLRTVPLALAGGFLSARAALLAATMAALVRYGIGGSGMITGVLVIFCASGVGYLWQRLRHRGIFRGRVAYFSLGGLTASTMLVGILLPEPLRTWFFLNAAPVLLPIYLTILPVLAWAAESGFLLDSVNRQTARALLHRSDIMLLSLPAFIHQMRLNALKGPDSAASAVLCLRIEGIGSHGNSHPETRSETLLQTILLRLTDAVPNITVAGSMNGDTLLLAITQDQVKDLDRIRDLINERLSAAPLHLSRTHKHWISYELGLMRPENFEDGGQLVPQKLTTCHLIDRSPATVPTWGVNTPRSIRANKNFERFKNTDMLFLKARFLMEERA